MNASPAEPPSTYREQMALLRKWKNPLRLLAYLFLIWFLTPFLLGLVFTMMLFPLLWGFIHLVGIYTPAYHLMGRMLGVEGLPARLAKPPTWVFIYAIAFVIFPLWLVALLVRQLFFVGFCNQNLVCMFAPLILR